MVWQGPRLGFVAETGRSVASSYGDALSTIFLLACFCALLPTFRFSLFFSFFSHFFPASRYVLSSSCPFVQQPSATLSKYQVRTKYFIVRVLSACCVICALPHVGILLFLIRLAIFFRSSYSSGGVFFAVLSYPVR